MSTMSPAVAGPPPRFSVDELRDRRDRLLASAAEAGADTVLAYGANRFGSAVGWLTTWPVTREAVVVLDGDGPARLLVGFPNHVPDARRTVRDAGLGDEVGMLDGDAPDAVLRALASGGAPRRVALLGPVPGPIRDAVAGWATGTVRLDEAYTRLRMTKSAEELTWLEYAAALTDRGAQALLAAAATGASEREMVAAAEHAYRAAGGTHHICYVTTTSMADPDRCVPAQWPGDRRTEPGSVVIFELSAGWGPDHPAQLLRTATVGAPPTARYAHLHRVAEEVRDDLLDRIRPGARPADLLGVLDRVRAEGLTTVDDLVHGLGGGYLPPVLSGRGRPLRGPHAEPLRPGMTLVVQPNICTTDLVAGVQTGEMVVVTAAGWRSLHRFPAGMPRL
ncbi:Xaa-Pro aminopeptidase [Plantactinospora soyae]|uniref:Xaa-Pro aminopeptidase n=2 Tax=Plantactinospora soyae TaxID=1544732 RepID=A0A927MBK0_9ACTN|nr:Xaa-Pro aminopeptidase [Plantactinospora soyae]